MYYFYFIRSKTLWQCIFKMETWTTVHPQGHIQGVWDAGTPWVWVPKLGAQTRCPKNHKPKRTSYTKCTPSIITFRVLKNHQNAGNGIFKIFQGPSKPPEGSHVFGAWISSQIHHWPVCPNYLWIRHWPGSYNKRKMSNRCKFKRVAKSRLIYKM